MRQEVTVTGAVLVALGLGIFGWKTLALELPVLPSDVEGLWRVELEVDVRGRGRRGSVSAALPSTGSGQLVSDERVASDRLLFTVREDRGQRKAVWSGVFEDLHSFSHGFRVQLAQVRSPLPDGPVEPPSPYIQETYGRPSPDLPVDAPEIHEAIERLNMPGREDPAGRVRTLFAFVADEVSLIKGESSDVLLVLNGREGNAIGKARLLATLLRADGWPSRLARGLELSEKRDPKPAVWVESWLGGRWVPMSPSAGFFAKRPADILLLRTGDSELLRSTGVAATASRYTSLRERLSADELASMMKPPNPVLAQVSLYRLPVSSQGPLRLLLLIPLGALAMALMRNVVGVPTFGTFLPVLVALALRGTDLEYGLMMLATVIGLGAISRLLLDRLHLLLVPRLCIILCVVVLIVTSFAVVARNSDSSDLFGGILLPIVILAMLIERFSIATAEEGLPQALILLGWTALVAVSIYPIFRSEFASSLFFGFPELVFAVMGLLVWVGGYTGFRLFELIRFRAFAGSEHAGPR